MTSKFGRLAVVKSRDQWQDRVELDIIMKRPKYSTFLVICVVCLCVCVAGWIVFRFYHVPIIETPSHQQVKDIPISEGGPFSGEKFKPLRQSYFTNLEMYRLMKMQPAEVDPRRASDLIYSFLAAQLRADRRNDAALANIPEEGIQDLSNHIGLILSRASGMSFEEYSRYLDDGSRMVIPANLPSEALDGLGIKNSSGGVTSTEDIRKSFDVLYHKAASSLSDTHRLVSWSITPTGFRVGVAENWTTKDDENVLSGRFNKEEMELYRGMLAQSSYIFHRMPYAWSDIRAKYTSLGRFEGVIIVEDAMGDRYPLWMSLWYDPARKRWWITNVYRMVSVRAAVAPSLVY